MNTTLENLTMAVKENRLRQFGENIVKYQKFKTNAIINKIDNIGYSKATLISYINSGIRYIYNGTKYRQYGDFYKYIDEAIKKHIQPLTPSFNERRIEYKYKKINKQKQEISSVQKVLNDLSKQHEEKENKNNNFYGVLMNKNIRIFDSLVEAKAFKDGLSFMGNISTNIIKLNYKELVYEIHN